MAQDVKRFERLRKAREDRKKELGKKSEVEEQWDVVKENHHGDKEPQDDWNGRRVANEPQRISQYIARRTGLSRRESERMVLQGRVRVNGEHARVEMRVCDMAVMRMAKESYEFLELGVYCVCV